VRFPDLPDTFTEGYGLSDAFEMATDVLAEMNWNKRQLPHPSSLNSLRPKKGELVALITANLSEKRRTITRIKLH
jgi:hypothetical protein